MELKIIIHGKVDNPKFASQPIKEEELLTGSLEKQMNFML